MGQMGYGQNGMQNTNQVQMKMTRRTDIESTITSNAQVSSGLNQVLQSTVVSRSPSSSGGGHIRPHGDHRTGGGRHALPQTRLDGLWNGYAPRPVDLQPRQAADQLGARLGRPYADYSLPLLGSYQGLEFAAGFSLVSQSPGSHQGKEEVAETETAEARPQPPHAARIGGGADFAGGKLVSPAKTARQWRQRLWRGERVAEAPAQRGTDQPCASQRTLVRTGPGTSAAPAGSASEEGATTARHDGLGRRLPATLAETGLPSVWPACHVAGEDDPGVVLQGGQRPAVDDRSGARCAGQTARSDVLQYLSVLGRARFSRRTRQGGRSRSPSRIASNCWGWKTRPTAKKRQCGARPRWRWYSTA